MTAHAPITRPAACAIATAARTRALRAARNLIAHWLFEAKANTATTALPAISLHELRMVQAQIIGLGGSVSWSDAGGMVKLLDITAFSARSDLTVFHAWVKLADEALGANHAG